jgi:glyoxylase I family protein
MSMFKVHHITLSVSDAKRSKAFYSRLGFEEFSDWYAPDGSLSIHHVRLEEVILELFCYSENENIHPRASDTGNNLPEIGIKHFALRVELLEEARDTLEKAGIMPETDNIMGHTGIRYFFVRDPDGNWVEIVTDERT